MAKRKKHAKRSKASNSCCPVIQTKCGRGGRGGGLGDAGIPGFQRDGLQMLAAKSSAAKTARIKAHKIMCTIRVGSHVTRVNALHFASRLKKIVAAQKRKRCVVSINGRLVEGRRAGKF